MNDKLAKKLQMLGLIGPIGDNGVEDYPYNNNTNRFFNMLQWYANDLGYPAMTRPELANRIQSGNFQDLKNVADRIRIMRRLNNQDMNQPGMFDRWFHYTK